MTGYGKATGTYGARRYTVELRSLNGKQLDLSVRMPSVFREHEMSLRKQLAAELERGKSDLTLSYEMDPGEARQALNAPVIAAYLDQIRAIAATHDLPQGDWLTPILRLPDVVQQPQDTLDEAEWAFLSDLVAQAIAAFNGFREQEGATIAADFTERIATIAALEAGLDDLLTARIARVKARMQQHLDEALERARVDANRFEQEVLFYLEKMDVSEERQRLRAHLSHFTEILEGPSGQGKKLGFIAQEIGREINTLGSKANDSEIQRRVVAMKDELEKIKEQVLNAL